MIKSIKTKYNECLYRSRLEARWAVFFDELGIKHIYEHEGFNINGTKYLPDFLIPSWGLYLEIKPFKPTHSELKKAYLLKENLPKEKSVGILYGFPRVRVDDYGGICDLDYVLLLLHGEDGDDHKTLFSECRRCSRILFQETIEAHIPTYDLVGDVQYGCCDRIGDAVSDDLLTAYSSAISELFH